MTTFGDMAGLKRYKFTRSFSDHPLQTPLPGTGTTVQKPRTNPLALEHPDPWPPGLIPGGVQSATARRTGSGDLSRPVEARPPRGPARESARRAYWHALIAATQDLDATPEEAESLHLLRDRYALDAEEIRALHARLFAERVLDMARDDRFTGAEVQRTERLASALRLLGWCPGIQSSV